MTILAVWLIGVPVAFWLLTAIYPTYLRRRYQRPPVEAPVALVVPLPEKRVAS